MIIEDNEDILELTSLALKEHGYAVITGSDGRLLHEMHVHQPDLILVDNLLKHDTGNNLCLRLKADPDTMHVPVVLVSAHTALEEMAVACGADACLSKPFSKSELLKVVRRFV